MKPSKKIGNIFKPIFLGLEQDILARVKDGDVKEEDHITTTLFTLAKERIDKLATETIGANGAGELQITARQFTGRGRNSEESFIGADGAVSLHVRLGDLEIQKFYIFQAKKFGPKSKIDARAVTQRQRMLECSPDSFFLIYTPSKMYYVSAFMVGQDDKLSDLPSKGFNEFNQDFFNCFIGDHFLGFPDLPFRRPWRYGPYDGPVAKNNLIIEVSDKKQ